MRGRNVDVRFGESFALEVTPRKLEQSQAVEEVTTVRGYKQFLVNVSQKSVVNLSHRPVFEGRMLGEHKVAGETFALVENEREILVTPSTPSLKARYKKDVVVYAERGPDGGLHAWAKSRDRGMDR